MYVKSLEQQFIIKSHLRLRIIYFITLNAFHTVLMTDFFVALTLSWRLRYFSCSSRYSSRMQMRRNMKEKKCFAKSERELRFTLF